MKTNRKSKRKKGLSLNLKKMKYIAGLVLLVAVAFQLPRLLFAARDRERMSRVERGSRQNTNFAALEENYEPSVFKRLYDFAEGVGNGKTYYVSEMTAELSAREQTELLEQTFFESDTRWFLSCAEVAWRHSNRSVKWFWGWYFDREKERISDWTVTDLKKYVIYDSEKVNFICWYLEVELDATHTIRALVDTEDGTVYYIQGLREYGEAISVYDSNGEAVPVYDSDGEQMEEYVEEKAKAKGKTFYEFRDEAPAALLWGIAMSVYESDWEYAGMIEQEDVLNFLKLEPDEWLMEVINYGEIMDWIARGEVEAGEQVLRKVVQELEVSGDRFTLPLYYYGDRKLLFEVEYELAEFGDQDGQVFLSRQISVGISGIGELVPEFGQ